VARCVWALAEEGITEHVSMNDDPSARNWLFAMMESLPRDDFARVAVTLWAIWYARRKIVHEGEFQSPLSTHLFIENYLRDLSIAGTTKGKAVKEATKHPRWVPPREGTVKLNVDAAMAKDGCGGAVGVVCRDGAGVFVGAATLTIKGISDPATLEAIACREALALASDLQLQRVTVASDCLAVVNAMKGPFAGAYSMVVQEVKARSNLLEQSFFRHENRLSNSEAHRLARFAISLSVGRQVWLVQPPDGLCIPNNIIF
jgi:ribonuclease HI